MDHVHSAVTYVATYYVHTHQVLRIPHFERRAHGHTGEPDTPGAAGASRPAVDLKNRMRAMWD
jgi:hypothetical protein